MAKAKQLVYTFPGRRTTPTGLLCFLSAFVFHTPMIIQHVSVVLVVFHVLLAAFSAYKIMAVNEDASMKSVLLWVSTIALYGLDSWHSLCNEAIPDWLEKEKQGNEEARGRQRVTDTEPPQKKKPAEGKKGVSFKQD